MLQFSAGPLTLRPQFGVAESFDSNVFFLAPPREEADFVSVFSPGLKVGLGGQGKPLAINLTFSHDESIYARLDSLNHADDRILLTSSYQGAKFQVTGSDSFSFLSGPLGSYSLLTVGGAAPLALSVDHNYIIDGYRFDYNLSDKTFVALGASHTGVDYQQGLPLYDYQSFRGAGDFGYKPFSKISFFGEVYYQYIATHPNFYAPPTTPVTSVGLFLGLKGDFTSKLSGTLQFGYEQRDYGSNFKSSGTPVAQIDLSYDPSPKRRITFSYSRVSTVAVESGSTSLTLDQISLRLNQNIGTQDRFSVQLGANVRSADYETLGTGGSRNDVYFMIDAGVFYKFYGWLAGSLSVQHEVYLPGTKGLVDYDANRVTLKLTAGY